MGWVKRLFCPRTLRADRGCFLAGFIDALLQRGIDRVDDKLEKSLEFVAGKLERLKGGARGHVYAGGSTSAPLKEVISEKGMRAVEVHEQFRRPALHPVTGEQIEAKGLFADPIFAGAAGQWFLDSARLQLPQRFSEEREEIVARHQKANRIFEDAYGKAALTEGAAGASGGHYLVPAPVQAEVLRIAQDSAVVFGKGRHVPMTGDKLEFPNEATGIVVGWAAEAENFTATDPTLGVTTLEAKKIVARTSFSIELSDDSVVAIMPWIQSVVAEKFGRESDAEALEGTGTNWTGVLSSATPNEVGSQTTGADPTYKNMLLTVIGAGEDSTRKGAAWFMNPLQFGNVLNITDGNDRPIWSLTPLVDALGYSILGRPAYPSNAISAGRDTATLSSGNVYFGDPSTLIFGDRTGMRFGVSEHVSWGNDMLDVKMTQREAFACGLPAAWTVYHGVAWLTA